MASVAQTPLRSWDTKRLMFHVWKTKTEHFSIKRFWKQYENGSWISVYIDRTAYHGPTNSARVYSHGAPVFLFTVNKYKQPLTEEQAERLERLAEPSCGTPNTGHVWSNDGITNI